MTTEFATDITIIGAGPAGMAAATRLSEGRVAVTVLDQADSPGGQIYRQLSDPAVPVSLLGKDYERGRALIDAFTAAPVCYWPGSRVFWLERTGECFRLGIHRQGQTHTLVTRQLILATGAMERPQPFPGWQLPGVMTVGSAQILLKQSGLLPDQPPVLAGTGPLLYLLAHQLLKAGQRPRTVLDVSPARSMLTPLTMPIRSWRGRRYLFKGLGMMAALKAARVPIVRGVRDLAALGGDHLTGVRYRTGRRTETLPTTALLTHFGVVAEPQTARALGVPYHWDEGQQAFTPQRDDDRFQAGDNLWMIGDCGGIRGAINAEMEGDLLARQLLGDDLSSLQHGQRQRRNENAVRPVLERLFRPPETSVTPTHDTLICRCESVRLGQLQQAMADGAHTPDQLKTFTRCGMGPCQGRLCGLSATQALAQYHNRPVNAVGYFRIRTPIAPVTLGELGRLHTTDQQ